MINYMNEATEKLEIVENYSPLELKTIIALLEAEMFYDRLGQPYTREYFRNVINRSGVKND